MRKNSVETRKETANFQGKSKGGRWREGRMKGISGHDSKSEGMIYDSFPPSSLSLLGI